MRVNWPGGRCAPAKRLEERLRDAAWRLIGCERGDSCDQSASHLTNFVKAQLSLSDHGSPVSLPITSVKHDPNRSNSCFSLNGAAEGTLQQIAPYLPGQEMIPA